MVRKHIKTTKKLENPYITTKMVINYFKDERKIIKLLKYQQKW